jgi:hypothetical protein
MPRLLKTRLDEVEGRRVAAADEQDAAALRRRRLWRAEAAIGAVIREALALAGVDAAGAARLALADEAAAALAALPDTPGLQRADGAALSASSDDRARAAAFAPKILAMTTRYAGAPPPDLADASFAELFAWSLAQRPGDSP